MRHIAVIFAAAAKDGGHIVSFQNRQTGIAAGRKRCESYRMTGGGVGVTLETKLFGDRYGYRKVLPVHTFFLVLNSFSISRKIEMPEDTLNFSIDPDGGMTPSGKFTYIGHQVEIVPPDTARLIGNYWQIKIDGVLQHNFRFNSARRRQTKRRSLSSGNRSSLCPIRALRNASRPVTILIDSGTAVGATTKRSSGKPNGLRSTKCR